MSYETTEYADGTLVVRHTPFGLHAGFVKARLLCSDGKVRPTVRMSASADSFTFVACAVRVKGMTVSGFMAVETRNGMTVETDADPLVARFTANAYGRNADMLPGVAA